MTYELIDALIAEAKSVFCIKNDVDIFELKASEIPIMDEASTGSNVIKTKFDAVFLKENLKNPDADVDENSIIEEKNDDNSDDFLEQFRL